VKHARTRPIDEIAVSRRLGSPQLIADPWKNFLVIMKDGKIYKNAR